MTLTQSKLKELVHYDPITGVFTWNRREGDSPCVKRFNARFAGKRAGTVDRKTSRGGGVYDRRRIRIAGKVYKEHRLAFLYMEGSIPENVDHENRDATDNRWCNLRRSTQKENMKNISLAVNNTSGVSGVCWDKARGKWKAKAKKDGRTINLGHFTEIDEAAMEVLEFRAENGYSRYHGLEPAPYEEELVQ